MKSGNAYYHSAQNLISSSFQSKYIKIQMYITVNSPVVMYGSLTLKEEHKLRVFENWLLRRIFGSEGDEVTGE